MKNNKVRFFLLIYQHVELSTFDYDDKTIDR